MSNIYNERLQSNNSDLDSILSIINNLPTNSENALPILKNEGKAAELLLNKELINSNGEIIKGTMMKVAQATPLISLDTSNGLVTANAIQSSGYVKSGIKNSSYQIAFQPAKQIMPSTMDQIAVSSNYYTGGDIVVIGDTNLIPENIRVGASIFGVQGNYSSHIILDNAVLERSIAGNYTNSELTLAGRYAFATCSSLINVELPQCSIISEYAFMSCSNLTTISCINASIIQQYAFSYCSKLNEINFPKVKSIYNSAFYGCTKLVHATFPEAIHIGSCCFDGTKIQSLDLPKLTTTSSYAFRNLSTLTSFNAPILSYVNWYCFTSAGFTSINFPNVREIANWGFASCKQLSQVYLPKATRLSYGCFYSCPELKMIYLPTADYIGGSNFYGCQKLSTMFLFNNTLCSLTSSTAFTSTPFATTKDGTIYVPIKLINEYKSNSIWSYFADQIHGLYRLYRNNIPDFTIYNNENQKIGVIFDEDFTSDNITINSNNSNIISIDNIQIKDNMLFFNILSSTNNLGTATISLFNNEDFVFDFNITVIETGMIVEVVDISSANYGFKLNNEGYYESENKGVNDSYAICRLNIDSRSATSNILYLDCINFAESKHDFGLISKLDTPLALSSQIDSDVFYSFSNKQQNNIQTVEYPIPEGQHFIEIKFRKDGSAHKDNDSLQFKIRFES